MGLVVDGIQIISIQPQATVGAGGIEDTDTLQPHILRLKLDSTTPQPCVPG